MQKRNPFVVLLLSIVTFGIYTIYWSVVTKIAANKAGAQIPTAWLLIIPLVNIYWLWKLAEGLGQVTNQQVSPIAVFLLIFFLGALGVVIVQFMLNGASVQPQAAAPVAADPTTATSIPVSDEPTPPLGPTPPTTPTPPTPPTPPQAPTPPTTPPAAPPAAPVV